MSKRMTGISLAVMLFVFFAGVSPAFAADSLLPQVVYQFEVYEFESTEEYGLLLEAITIRRNESRELGFGFSWEEGTLDVFSPTPAQLVGMDSREEKIRMATPGLVVLQGRTSTLRVVEERLVSELYTEETPFQLSGMEISASPIQITREGSIYSAYDIKTFDSDNILHTEVWSRTGEQLPLAIVEVEGERLFAVFVEASLAGNLEGPTRAVGNIGGLGDLIWERPDPVLEWEGRVWVVLPLNPIELPEGGLVLRLDPKFYVDGEYQRTTSYSYLAVGVAIMDGGPNIDARWVYVEDQHLVALGVSDRVEAYPGLYLEAGFSPLVFDLADGDLQDPHWWVQVQGEHKALRGSIRYQSGAEKSVLTAQVGVEVAKNAEIFARVTHANDNTRFGLGVSFHF